MAFKVGSGQSRDTDVQNLSRRFTDDGMPYMYGSYKDTTQYDRTGGDDYQGNSGDGATWRTYVPDWPTSAVGYATVADQGNPTNFGYAPLNSSSYGRGNQFVAAAGKLFIGAPYTYADAYDAGSTSLLTGCVFVCHPHRLKSVPHSTEFQLSVNAYTDSYGIYGRRSGRGNANAFELLWPVSSLESSGFASKPYFGGALAYANGKLFVSHPNSTRTISGVVTAASGGVAGYGRVNTNESNEWEDGFMHRFEHPGTAVTGGDGPSDIKQSSYFGVTMGAGCGKIAVTDYDGHLYIKGITDADDDFPREAYADGSYRAGVNSDENGWKKIKGPTDDDGRTHDTGTRYGNTVKVGCGRILVASPYATVQSPITGNLVTNAGIIYLYDLHGNLIKKMYPPNGPAYNGYFGFNIAVGSGRIVAVDASSNSVAIYDLDGDLITLKSNLPFGYSHNAFSDSVAVGFGRIFVCKASYDNVAGGTDTGIIWGYDLDGNYLGQIGNGGGTFGSGYPYADLGLGGIQITPGRMYALATNYSSNGSIPTMIHETPIHTIMTPWDVQALEDGDK